MALTPILPTTHVGEVDHVNLIPNDGWVRIDDDFDFNFNLPGYSGEYLLFLEDALDFDYNDLGLHCSYAAGCIQIAKHAAANHTWEIVGNESLWNVNFYSSLPGHTVFNASTLDRSGTDRIITYGKPIETTVPEPSGVAMMGLGLILMSRWIKKHFIGRY